jgi:hypothetical protein
MKRTNGGRNEEKRMKLKQRNTDRMERIKENLLK